MLEFITSLTVCPSDIRKIVTLLKANGVSVSHNLGNILVTPLFVQAESLSQLKAIKEDAGTRIMFDSGGYYVQTGRLSYTELYFPLLTFYKANPWADVYTLPDHVPTSQDTADEVWEKVKDTVRFSRLFYEEMPSAIRKRAMPVVQGHTYEQIDYCLRAYLELDVRYIGFGSFGTSGAKSEINTATNNSVALARHVVKVAERNGLHVHFFGLGAPALVAMIYGIGADSFDSSSWLKSAGFGQIFLPFMRAHNISHRNMGSDLQKGITIQRFEQYRELTNHHCPFCTNITRLQQKKMYRALHNLIAVRETVEMVNERNFDAIEQIYRFGSPRYKEEFKKWLSAI